MNRHDGVLTTMFETLPPLSIFATIALPAPILVAFVSFTQTASALWEFLTVFGVAAAPAGIGLAIVAHILGKKLGSLVGRIDMIVNAREGYITRYELPSLSTILKDAGTSLYLMRTSVAAQNTEAIDTNTVLRILPHLHAIRAAIISTRLTKLDKTVPLEEIDHVIHVFAFAKIDHASLLVLDGALLRIRAVVRARMEAAARARRTL